VDHKVCVINKTGDIVHIEETIIVDAISGVVGLCSNDDEICDNNERLVRICMDLPMSFFEPIWINVEVPKELIAPMNGSVSSIAAPVMLDEDKHDIVIKESVQSTNSFLRGGILCMLKRAVEYLEKEDEAT